MKYRVVEKMNDMYYIEYQKLHGNVLHDDNWHEMPRKEFQFGWPDSDEAIRQMNKLVEIDKKIEARNTLKRIVEESL